MPKRCGNWKTNDKFKRFWETKALRYPSPLEKGTIEKTLKVISMVQDKGVEIKGKEILDIGCGTGIYTLPLAREARHVTGLDSSENMIKRLNEEVSKNHISNISFLKESWKDVEIEAKGLKKVFDIAWCAMSMAVRDRKDFKKMDDCSKKWCVYIGWGRKRKNAMMEEAFRIHDLTYGPPPGAAVAYDILKDAGKNPAIEYFDESWEWEGALDEAIEDVAGFIEMRGPTADRTKLRELLGSYIKDDLIRHTTYVEEGLIVWQTD